MNFADWIDADRGRVTLVAAHFGITQSAVSQWRRKGVPLDRMKAMAALSGNLVTVEEMVPDPSQPVARRPVGGAAAGGGLSNAL